MTDDWPAILERDGPAAWRAAYRLLGNRADADECFQDACLAAFEVSRREVVRSWRAVLLRMVAARAVDRIRDRQRHAGRRAAPVDCDGLASGTPAPWQSAVDAELGERLRRALAVLPPNQAEVFCLSRLEDLSYRQIAEALRITVDSVGVLLHRARERLRMLLSDEEPAAAQAPRKEASR